LRRCLDKDPKRRLRDIGEARLALEGGAFETIAAPASALSGRLVWMVAFAVAAVLATALAIPAVRHLVRRRHPRRPRPASTSPRPPRTCPIHLLDLYQKHMSGAGVEERFVPSDQQQLVGGRSLSAVLQHRSEDEHRPLGGADDPPISCFVPALGCAVLQGRGDASAISGVI